MSIASCRVAFKPEYTRLTAIASNYTACPKKMDGRRAGVGRSPALRVACTPLLEKPLDFGRFTNRGERDPADPAVKPGRKHYIKRESVGTSGSHYNSAGLRQRHAFGVEASTACDRIAVVKRTRLAHAELTTTD